MLLVMLSLGPLALVLQRSLGIAGVYRYKPGPKRSHHADASCLQLKAAITQLERSVHILFPPFIPCTMPPEPRNRDLSSRFVPFSGPSRKPAVNRHQGSHEVASVGAESSSSAHPSTHPAPKPPLRVENSTPTQFRESQPPVRQSRSKDNVVPRGRTRMAKNQDFVRQPRPQPFPAQQYYSNSAASESRSFNGGPESPFPDASRYRRRDPNVYNTAGNGAGDGSIDGTPTVLRY
jgi:hypothetical protein